VLKAVAAFVRKKKQNSLKPKAQQFFYKSSGFFQL